MTTLDQQGTAFLWGGNELWFDGDERVDLELVTHTAKAWADLEESLSALTFDQDEAWASRILVIYYATRLHGATAGATMLLAHRQGREAMMLARSQFESFIRMLYYTTFSARASDLVSKLNLKRYLFEKRARIDVESRWSPELRRMFDEAKDGRITLGEMITQLEVDGDFRNSRSTNPFAEWFFKNAWDAYRVLWMYASEVMHASIIDLPNVIVGETRGEFALTVDSRMKAPNKQLLDLAQRCYSAAGLIRRVFSIETTPDHVIWGRTFEILWQRHAAEVTGLGSMHD